MIIRNTTRMNGLDGLLQELRVAFAGHRNLFLRGSAVRGEPYNDIDISAYNEEGVVHSPPIQSINGKPIEFGGIPQAEIAHYFSVSLRTTSSLMELVPIGDSDKAVLDVIKTNRAAFQGVRKALYLMYLQLEEHAAVQKASEQPTNDYHSLKRFPGSRRTIGRIVWTLRSIPGYENILSTSDLLQRSVLDGAVPEKVSHYASEVLDELPRVTTGSRSDKIQFMDKCSVVADFMHSYIRPQVVMRMQRESPELYTAIYQGQNESEAHITQSLQYAVNAGGCEEWAIAYALCNNRNTPNEVFRELIARHAKDKAYHPLLRSIIQNPAATDDTLAGIDYSDKYAVRYLERRRQLAHSR